MQDEAEKRRHARFTIDEGIFAAFKALESPHYSIVGGVVDVSKQGIAVQYCVLLDEEPECGELKIFGKCTIDSLPCKVVYRLDIESRTMPGLLRIQRCGMELGEMTQAQKAQMYSLVQNHSVCAQR